MKMHVKANEPQLLREATQGDLFLVHRPGFEDQVHTLCDVEFPTERGAARSILTVAIGCRVGRGEPGFCVPGCTSLLHPDTPITILDQVGTAHFVQRRPPIAESECATPRTKGRVEATFASGPYAAPHM